MAYGYVNYSWTVYTLGGSSVISGSCDDEYTWESVVKDEIENSFECFSGTTYKAKLYDGNFGYIDEFEYTKSGTSSGSVTVTVTSPDNNSTETESASSSTTDDPTNSNPPSTGGGTGNGSTTSKSSQTWTLANKSVTYGSTIDMDNALSGTTYGTKTWSVTNGTGSATIDASSGVLTPSKVGTVTVQLYAAGNSSYNSRTKTCTVTIAAASASQTWTLAAKSVAYGSTIDMDNAISGTAYGTKTWSVTNGTGSATIDASSGVLTPSKVGTVTVTLVASGGVSGNYNYSSLSKTCTVTITAASASQTWTLAAKSVAYGSTIDMDNAISGTTYGTKTWSVTNGTGSATIDKSSGVLTPSKVGTVTVSLTASGGTSGNYNYSSSTKTCTVTITAASASQTWTLSAKSVTYGSTLDMNTAISGTVYGGKTWSVSNGTGSATINASTGLLTPTKVGTVTVTLIASGGVSGNYNYSSSTKTCTVTINNKQTQTLAITYGSVTVTNGASTVRLRKGSTVTLVCSGNASSVSWSTENSNVILSNEESTSTLLSNTMIIKGNLVGSCKVYANCAESTTHQSATAYANIEVYDEQSQTVSIKKENNTDASGSKITVGQSLNLVSSSSASTTSVESWSITSGGSYAGITYNGNKATITAKDRGAVKVKVIYKSNNTYTTGSKEITLYVYANQNPTVSISNNSVVYTSDSDNTKTKQLTISVTNSNTTASYKVKSGNISLTNNKITATGSTGGTASITVTCPEDTSNYWNKWEKDYTITIKHEKTIIDSSTPEPSTTSSTKMAQSFTLTAKTITYGDSNAKMSINGNYFGTLTWHSSDTSVAEVCNEGSDIGIIRYKKVGSTNISLTASGDNTHQSYTCEKVKLEIIKQTGTSFSITGENTVAVGSTLQLKENDTTDRTITWSSSNSSIATVNSNTGIVTGKSTGEVIITATANESSTMKSSTARKTIEVSCDSTTTNSTTSSTTSTTSNTPPPVNLTTPEFDIEDVTISVLNSKLSSTKDFISNLKYDSGKKAVIFEIKPKFKDSNEDKFNFTYEITDAKIINYDNITGLFKINNNGTTSVKIKGTVKTEYSSNYTSEVSRTFNITIKDTYTINTVFYIDFVPNLDKYVTCTESSIGRLKRYTFNIPPSYITNSNNPILGNITLNDGILNNPYNTYDEYYKSIEVTCNTDYIKIEKINNNEIQLTAIKYYGDKFLSIKLTHPEVQKGCYKYSKASSEIQIQTLTYNLIQYLNLRNNNIFEFDADEAGLIAKNDCQYFFDVFNYYPAIEQISTVDYEIIFHTYEDDKNLIVELKKILTNNGSTIIYIYYDKTLFGFIHNNKGYASYEPYVLEKEYGDNLYGDVKNNVLFNGIIISLNCDINVYDYTESGYIKNAEQYYNKKISLNNITNLHPGYTNIYQIKVKELIKQIGNLKLNNNTNRDYLNYYIRLNSKSLKLQYYDYHKNGGLFDCNSVISTEENSMICLTNLLYTYNDGKYISDSVNGDNNDNATLEIVIPKDYNNSENNVEIEIGFDLCITDAYNENSNMNNYAFNIKYKNNKNIIKRLNINSVNKEIIEYTYNGSNYTALHFRLPKSQLTNIISNYNDIYKLLSINYTYHNSYNSISNDTTIIDYLNSYNAAKLNELYSFSKITKTINVYGCRESSLTRFSDIFDLSYKLIDYDSVTITLTAENAFDKCNWVFYGIRHVGDGTGAPTDDWTKSIIEIINYDVNNNGKCDKIKLRVYKHQDLLKLKEIKVVCTIDETIKYYKSSASIILAFDNIYSGTSSTATPLPSSTPSPSSTPASSSTPSPMTTLLG